MLIRRSVWDQLGGMDIGFFLHFEDLDLMARMQEHGWQVGFQPKATVSHIGGYSSQKRPLMVSWHKHKSLLRYLLKHHRRSFLSWTVLPMLAMGHFVVTAPWLLLKSR